MFSRARGALHWSTWSIIGLCYLGLRIPMFTQDVTCILLRRTIRILQVLMSRFVNGLTSYLPTSCGRFFNRISSFILSVFLHHLSNFLLRRVSRVIKKRRRFIYRMFRKERSFNLQFITLRVIICRYFRFRRSILINYQTNSRLTFMRARTMIRRRLSITHGRALTILVSKTLSFRLGLLRAIRRSFFLIFKRVRYLNEKVKGRKVLLCSLSRQNTFCRIKIRRRTKNTKLRAFRRISLNRLTQNRTNCHTFLMVMVLFSVTCISTFNIFRRGNMCTVIRNRVPKVSNNFKRVSCTSRQVRNFRARRLIMLICDVRLSCFFRGHSY